MRESHLAALLKDNGVKDNCMVDGDGDGDGDGDDRRMRSAPWSGFRAGLR
jgi:hypothetical protein